jgi:hypothetical protein
VLDHEERPRIRLTRHTLTLFSWHRLNLRHVVVPNGTRVSIIPINGNSTPSHSDDRAKIGGAAFPANAVADVKLSGLVAGHLTRQIIFGDTL